MAPLQVLLFLLLCALALGWLSRRINLPYPIALVIGGSALGFVPGLPQLQFDPQLLLVLVLPPILYQAALLTSWRDFKANLRPIGFLAIGLVIVTTLAVGAALKLLFPEMPWAVAFVFGAIVSPPDAVAATAVLSRYNIPHRVVVVLEGESLVNDASGLVLYKFAVAAVLTGAFSLAEASVQFALVALGGIAVGMVIAWVFVQLHRYIGDPFIEVLVSMSIPYTAYIAAESVHLSGVLAVVAAGLFRGRYAPMIVSAEMRILARSVWNIFVFLLNSMIFILIGLQLSGIAARLGNYAADQLALASLCVSAVAILLDEDIVKLQQSQSYAQPAQLFWNCGASSGASFMEVPAAKSGPDLYQPIVGRGSAFADIDGDGDLDVALTQTAGPPLLLRNDQQLGHHWLRLKLAGTKSNRDAIGVWVRVRAGGMTQSRQVMPTRSYLSQSELTLTFGLGQADKVEEIEIIWPGGRSQHLGALPVNQFHRVEEPR